MKSLIAPEHKLKVFVPLGPHGRFCAYFIIATNQVAADWGLHIAFLSKGINQKDKAPHRAALRVKTDQQPERESEWRRLRRAKRKR